MSDINTWKLKNGNNIIGQVLSFEKSVDRSKIVSKSLNGTIYIQTLGNGTTYADSTIFCSALQRDALNLAEALGSLLTLTYRDQNYVGYIEDVPEWETNAPGEWYTATIKFLIEGTIT